MEDHSMIQVFTSGSASLLSMSTAFPVTLVFNPVFIISAAVVSTGTLK